MPIESRQVVYLAPHDDCYDALLRVAQAATASIHVLIYSITMNALADILIQKHQQGLEVGVVADKTQSAGKAQKALLQRLVDAGVSVTIATSVTGAILHTKALLVDIALEGGANNRDSFVAFGSYNFSGNPDPKDPTNHKASKIRGAQAEDNILITQNSAELCSFIYGQYLEAQAYGREHCAQLKPATQPVLPTTSGEVAAATAPLPT